MPIFCPKTSFFFDGLILKITEEFRFVRRARANVLTHGDSGVVFKGKSTRFCSFMAVKTPEEPKTVEHRGGFCKLLIESEALAGCQNVYMGIS